MTSGSGWNSNSGCPQIFDSSVPAPKLSLTRKGMDEWGCFPHERRRLFDLILATKAHGVILLSGNVHFAEISQVETKPIRFWISHPADSRTSTTLTPRPRTSTVLPARWPI